MAHLKCVKHNKRVVVVESRHSDEFFPIADVFHRNPGEDSVKCYSDYVTIDGDAFTPEDVLSPDFSIGDYVEQYLNKKYDALIYS